MVPSLTAERQQCALVMLEAGICQSSVDRHCHCSQSMISSLVQHFCQTKSADDCRRSRGPRVTTWRQHHYIILQHPWDRYHPATMTATTTMGTHQHPVSGFTTSKCSREAGLTARRPFHGLCQIRSRARGWAWQKHTSGGPSKGE